MCAPAVHECSGLLMMILVTAGVGSRSRDDKSASQDEA